MNALQGCQDIPERVLDQAIAWAVALGAEEVDSASRNAFERWLQADTLHRSAWQRLQVVESEFVGVRTYQSPRKPGLPTGTPQPNGRTGSGTRAAGLLLLLVLLAVPLLPRPQAGLAITGGGDAAVSENRPKAAATWPCLVLRGLASLRSSADGNCRHPRACTGKAQGS